MNRFKFRAWDGKRMIYNIWIVNSRPYNSAYFDDFSKREIKGGIIMQWTGLKNEKDKDIYESDIVKYIEIKYQVKFCNNYACGGYYLYNFDGTLETECDNWNDCEIIGNIHENPELLNENLITDGFGQFWDKKCPKCGKDSMEIVRPGKVQCRNCG